MDLQWYPGHMAKTRRLIGQALALIDVVVELIDARAPESSRNPDFDALFAQKPRLAVMNKADLADERVTAQWQQWYAQRQREVIAVNSLTGQGMQKITEAAHRAIEQKRSRETARGLTRPVRLLIAGIPNVGKSSLINRMAGRAGAKTGDRPGVTRGQQWIKCKDGMEILDTPGILWPKFEDKDAARRLAYIGSIKDEVMDTEALACHLLEFLRDTYPERLMERYRLDTAEGSGYELLQAIAKKRGFVVSRGELDTERGANVLLDEFRGAKIGRITLERPQNAEV